MKTYFERYFAARMQDPEFRKAYEAAETKRVVYLVGWEDVEGHSVEHVCASEETARKRFEEIRKKLLKDAHENRNRRINKGRNVDWLNEYIVGLVNVTFDEPNGSTGALEAPFWSIYKVED
jgi:hypothetical protein